ncbi:MAG: IS5 family transposase [Chloroflexi bacterium]|nr:IS5 family transposase [Chloroflexota bacterium]
MQSKVHPTYKTKYRVANWPAYNEALVRRGDVTRWLAPEAIAAWTPRRSGGRGGQRRYSDLAIETALTLRLIYHRPLRQAEGFLRALFAMMHVDLAAPDYTTLSRRGQLLRRRLRPVPTGDRIHRVLDSTGLSIVGEGEWAAAKHGRRGRRGWKTLHRGVDRSGVIVAQTLTEATVDDATTARDLINAVPGTIASVTADAAYDTVAVYETAAARGATVVVPPAKTANVSRHGLRSPARDRTIRSVTQLGRRRWKKASGYHRQARVENAFFRYKSILGEGLRARSPAGQGSEVVLGCEILNQMTAFGRPASYSVGRGARSGLESCGPVPIRATTPRHDGNDCDQRTGWHDRGSVDRQGHERTDLPMACARSGDGCAHAQQQGEGCWRSRVHQLLTPRAP